MAYRFNFGGPVNNTNGYTDYSNNYFYSDYGSGYPSGNPSSSGGNPVVVAGAGADWASGATWVDIVALGGAAFRIRVGHAGGRLQVGRNTGNGSSMIDSADGYVLGGGIAGYFDWYTVPSAPTPLEFTPQAGGTALTRFSGNSDGGSGMLEWQIQIATNSGFTTGVQTFASSGTSTLTLTPGQTYWQRSRGRNAAGWGAWSSVLTATMLGGGKRWDGANGWKAAGWQRWNGTSWVTVTTNKRWTGSAWVQNN